MTQFQPGIAKTRRRRPRFYLFGAILGVAAAVAGFGKTFFAPLLGGTFHAPAIVYVHFAFLFGWVGFFLLQSILIQRSKLPIHKQAGWLGAGLAACVLVSTIGVALYASRKMIADGDVPAAENQLLTVLIDMSVFALLVGFAIQYRRRPEIHRRLMFLSLVQVLGPAWFRFRHYFPSVGSPLLVFGVLLADSLILLAMLYDYRRSKRVHPVYMFVGGGLFVMHLCEVTLAETAPFTAAASAVARLLL
jgi:hypothetical protein